MFGWARNLVVGFGLAVSVFLTVGSEAAAQQAEWRVGKSSGEVWVNTAGAQRVSLTAQTTLKSGDSVWTGRNGRVLLVRGEETILVSPNSVVGLPDKPSSGGTTTIIQQAGSIVLDVERRKVNHFSVETPYLAAVVKGTRFRVSVNQRGASVDVLSGRVEVADFKSGQFAMVLPGQTANVNSSGTSGLSLKGAGTLSPIQQGQPREPAVRRVPVPRAGMSAQLNAPGPRGDAAVPSLGVEQSFRRGAGNSLRINVPIGEAKLNIHRVTNGLASAHSATGVAGQETVWRSGALKPGNGAGKFLNVGNSGTAAGGVVVGASGAVGAVSGGTGSSGSVGGTVGGAVGGTAGTVGGVVSGVGGAVQGVVGGVGGILGGL